MRRLIVVLALIASTPCRASEVQFTLPDIDTALSAIAAHAQQFPLRFSSPSERATIEQQLKTLLVTLDAASAQYPDEPDVLLRAAFANAMGHNLDVPGCAEKAIADYERFLTFRPESQAGNYYYGAFLAGTATLRAKSIPYLKKAARLGMPDARYMAAIVYLSLDDKAHALDELTAYAKTNPDDATANDLRRDLERGDVKVVEKHAPPPDDVAVQAPAPAPAAAPR